MRISRTAASAIVAILVLAGCAARPQTTKPEKADAQAARAHMRGAVATVHPLASQAAIDAYAKGGNAVDAAVAAAVTLGVVDGHNSGIGGGCFMLVRTAGGELVALDGREQAPAAATATMFVRNGEADTDLSQNGPLASGVPGSVAVYAEATRRLGNLTLADALLPAAAVAEGGFPIDGTYARRIAAAAKLIEPWPATRALLLRPDGAPLKEGDVLRQPDLARTYAAIAREGPDYFYNGAYAQAVGDWMAKSGGVLTAADFAAYRMKRREPIVTRYRGHMVVGFPPPSSGGVHVAQILSMIERFDLAALHKQDEALRLHVLLGAMNLAFADRAHWLGDPAFAKVPAGLLDADYLKAQSAKITLDKALVVPGHGTPPGAATAFFDDELTGRHTTHIATADAHGNVVALTATVNTAFGSKVIVPGTGVILNNQMDDFAIAPGAANAFGLVGSDANAVAPGKRPLSSMSPTIVLKDGRPVLTIGAAGGPKIITQVVLGISNVIDLGDDVRTALARRRVHMQWQPESVWLERDLDAGVQDRLKALGHKLDPAAPAGATQAIGIAADGTLTPAHDPRLSGASMTTP
jgi:gamma-glutamyltranspeptidase/glutathione hydrolase